MYNHYADTEIGRLHRPENIEKTKRSVFDLEMSLPVTRSEKYHSRYPDVDIFIQEMSPDEYLDEILKYERLKINPEELQKVKNFYLGINIPEKLERYSHDMKRLRTNPVFTRGTDKFPMVMLERNSSGQTVANDGVHRVFAAKMAGIKRIPVYIVQEKPGGRNSAPPRQKTH